MDPIDTINTCHSNSLKQDQRGGSKKLEELKFNDALTVCTSASHELLPKVSFKYRFPKSQIQSNSIKLLDPHRKQKAGLKRILEDMTFKLSFKAYKQENYCFYIMEFLNFDRSLTQFRDMFLFLFFLHMHEFFSAM